MDPNLMKFLEEDEDETMHSGADVEAFTAELNRDIEGNASTSQQQPSDSAIKGSSQSHFLEQWETSSHDGVANYQSVQDIMAMEEKEQHSSQVDMQKHGSDSHNRKEDDNSSHEPNPLLHNPSMDGCPPSDDRNTFPLSQPMVTQTSAEQPISMQGLDREPKTEKEPQMDKVQNISHQPSIAMGLNDQQSSPMEFKDQHSLLTGQGNQQTDMGISSEQVMPPGNQHLKGMMMNSQQSMNSAMSNQQNMTNSNQQAGTSLKLNKQVPFGMLLPIIQPQLDKDRAMQLHTLYFKLKKNEITKDGFVRLMRSIVGDHMLKMAVYKLQTQASLNPEAATNQFQSQSQAPARQMQVPSSAQLPTELSNSTSENSAAKSREVDSQADSQGLQVSQMSNFSSGALSHERKHPAFPQGLNKQQHMQFPQASFPAYGNAGNSYSPFPATNAASSPSIRPQSHDPQMRQAPSHPNMAINHLGQTPRAMNMTNISKFERPHALSDPKKMMPENLTHMNSNMALQQNHVSSMTHVKQEPPDQTNQQHKAQLSSSHGLSSLTPPVKLGSAAPGNLKDEYFEMQSSRTGPNPPTSLVSTNSVPSPVPNPMETNVSSNSRMPSLTSSIGPAINSKAPPKKPMVGQKKPIETPGSSPPSSKKQKVSGTFLDQSIEHLNDVTAVSGVNLREEEEQLFSGPKEDSRVSEASRRVVQEEEDKLILQKIPLQKKVVEIMMKCGLKNMSNDVERCLSLCVEERMRGLISNIIRLSKQRVDIEKPRHKTIITSDVRQHIMTINRKAHEEWEKKQAETEKSKKLNEPDSSNGVDGDKEKDESRSKSTKANKEEDDKMRTTAANVAVRAATGVSDMLSRWQLMAEKQKQGGSDTVSQTSKDVGRKQAATSTRSTREHQESEKRDSSAAFTNPASVRKVGRNQVVVPRVARSISVKDVIGVLEREPQMSKSMLLYRLYQKVSAEAIVE